MIAWQKFKDHLGKIISGAGATLVSIDIMGVAEPLKNFAREALGDKGVKWVALGLFLALLARTWYTGRKAAQKGA
jgi:hypothetical protein